MNKYNTYIVQKYKEHTYASSKVEADPTCMRVLHDSSSLCCSSCWALDCQWCGAVLRWQCLGSTAWFTTSLCETRYMRTLRENVGRFYTYRVFQEHQIKEREINMLVSSTRWGKTWETIDVVLRIGCAKPEVGQMRNSSRLRSRISAPNRSSALLCYALLILLDISRFICHIKSIQKRLCLTLPCNSVADPRQSK